jgi:hypothetical protein
MFLCTYVYDDENKDTVLHCNKKPWKLSSKILKDEDF